MSCLFHSIGSCIGKTQEAVRAEIVHYMSENAREKHDTMELQHWIELAEDVSFQSYVENMKKKETWGGAVELDIACILYDSNIIIHFRKERFQLGVPRSRELHLKYTGNHFEPLGMRLTPKHSRV